jgi:hypothetical protein
MFEFKNDTKVMSNETARGRCPSTLDKNRVNSYSSGPWIRLCNSNNVFSTWVNQRVALSVVLCEVGLVKHIGNGLTSEQNQSAKYWYRTPIS